MTSERQQMQREYRELLITAQRYFDRSTLDHAATCPAKLKGGHPGESCKCGSWRAYEALEGLLLAGTPVDVGPVPEGVVWFAESHDPPGRYATAQQAGEPVTMTTDPLKARRFGTRDECLTFCCSTYASACLPRLDPVEHMFMAGKK